MKKIFLILVLFANYSYAQITHNSLRKNLTDAQISNMTDAVPGDTYISSDSNKIYSINQFGLAVENANNGVESVLAHWKSNTNGGVYQTNDIVSHNGDLYKNVSGANTDNSPDSDTANWTVVLSSDNPFQLEVIDVYDVSLSYVSSEGLGDSYAVENANSPHPNWLIIGNIENGDIIEFNGTNWDIILDVSMTKNGEYKIWNKADSLLYYFNGEAWQSINSNAGTVDQYTDTTLIYFDAPHPNQAISFSENYDLSNPNANLASEFDALFISKTSHDIFFHSDNNNFKQASNLETRYVTNAGGSAIDPNRLIVMTDAFANDFWRVSVASSSNVNRNSKLGVALVNSNVSSGAKLMMVTKGIVNLLAPNANAVAGENLYWDLSTNQLQMESNANLSHSINLGEVKSVNNGEVLIDFDPRYVSRQNIFFISDTASFPMPTNVGDELFISSDGSSSGAIEKSYIYDGNNWINTAQSSLVILGDVKQGFQSLDHDGWVKLDGRAISTLSSTQQANATTLGFTGSIPNASSSVLMQNGGALGSVSGSNTKTIAQANLPNITLTGYAIIQDSRNFASEATNGNSAYGTTGVVQNFAVTKTPAVYVGLGGSGTPLDIMPQTLSVNTFVYLGQ